MSIEDKCIERIRAMQENCDNTSDKTALEFAIVSVRKRIPAKATMAYCCPNCGKMIMQKQYYCDQCGQALDWRDD